MMNFTSITNFWRRKASAKESECASSESALKSRRAVWQDPEESWKRHTAAFESRQAALQHVHNTLETRWPNFSDVFVRSADDGDHGPVISRSLSPATALPALSKDGIFAVRRDRGEMIELLDLCLLAIPDDMPPEATADASDTRIFTQKCWRELLWGIVSVLVEIDRFIYTEIFVRPRHTREVRTSSGASPLTPRRLSNRSTITSLSAAPSGDGSASCGQTASSAAPNLPANTRKLTGAAEVDHPICALVHTLRSADEEFSILSSLTTWVTMRAILWKQLNAQRSPLHVTRSALSLNSDTELQTHDHGSDMLLLGSNKTFAVPWDDVVTELGDLCGVLPRRMVETLISLWMLHDPDREFIQCIVQHPLRPNSEERDTTKQRNHYCPASSASATAPAVHKTGNLSGAPLSVPAATTPSTAVNKASEGTKSNESSLHPALTNSPMIASTNSVPPSVSVSVSKLPLVVDDLVEQVECLYEQNVLQAWVAYIDNSIPMLFERGHDDAAPFDVCHCNRIAAFAVASPYWAEEKRQHIFQQLCEVCNEGCGSFASGDAHRTRSPSAFSDAPVAAAADSPVQSALLPPTTTTTKTTTTTTTGEKECRSVSVPSSLPEDFSDTNHDDDLLPLLMHNAWAAALHARVAQCVQLSPAAAERSPASPWAEEAERLALEERIVAAAGGTHAVRQRALESLFNARLCTGMGSGDARRTAETHYANAVREWEKGEGEIVSALAYMESMVLLARAQAACENNESVAETVQTAISQVALCERVLAHIVPSPVCVNSGVVASDNKNSSSSSSGENNHVHGFASGTTLLVRQAEARRRILQAKCAILREGWRAHYRLGDTTGAASVFENLFDQIQCLRRSQRGAESYAALRERGEQLECEKCYGNAVVVLKQAVECVKNATACIPQPTGSDSSSNGGTNVYSGFSGKVHDSVPASATSRTNSASPVLLRNEMGVFSSLYETDPSHPDAQHTSVNGNNHMLEWVRCEAESERNLALLYVLQAEHEVNVRQRRQQLSNAVNNAYAAQNALQRWTAKVQPPIGETLIDVAANLVATAKALLRLGQPKKAALLLDPLIEERVNSASVRPPRWTNAMEQTASSTTATEVTTCVQTLLVRITTYDVHIQCLSRFDGERACCEISRAREFANQVQAWAEDLLAEPSIQGTAARSLRQCLRATFALQRALTVACGDALAILSRWEDALQEYSNALASFADVGDVEKNCCETLADRERVQGDCRMGESLVLAKLAEVYTALGKPKTGIHYYNQVLEYASEISDPLLEYNARVHLARLYTTTGLTEEASAQWSKVSALAKEYEDQEISRETMRCIVTAQCAAGMYHGVIKTAEELDVLASAAEGVDAAADRRFALEALADAHLQLGQYKKCISALDEREKVPDKEGTLPGVLFSMRARALIGDGATQEAIKVLTSWTTEARSRKSWVEVGHANVALAFAYATTFRVLRAKRHHQIVLSTFADVSVMSKECCHAVLESARWLVHDFYLNEEEIPLTPADPLAPAADSIASVPNGSLRKSASKSPPGASSSSAALSSINERVSPTASGSSAFSSGDVASKTHALNNSPPLMRLQSENSMVDKNHVSGGDGKPGVLWRNEEQRLGAVLCGSNDEKDSNGSDGTGSNEESNQDNDDNDEAVDDAMELSNSSFYGLEDSGILDNKPTGSLMDNKKKTQRDLTEDLVFSHETHAPTLSDKKLSTANSQQKKQQPEIPTSTLGNVCLCKRLIVPESEISSDSHPPAELAPSKENQQIKTHESSDEMRDEVTVRKQKTVRTLCYHRALETMEAAAQLFLMPLAMRQHLVPRSPAEAVDLALLTFPRCTFVFYFAEFAAQYSVVVRPAGRSFFLKRSVQAYTLKDFHTVESVSACPQPQSQQPQQQQQLQNAASSTAPVTDSALSEHRFSAFTPSLSSLRCRSLGASTDHSAAHATPDAAAADELHDSLRDLHADLWAPVRDSLRFAGCRVAESECLVLVADPTLLHVPFPALSDASCGDALPLGQQAPLVVTPTAAHFLHATRRAAAPSPLSVAPSRRFVFFSEGARPCAWLSPAWTLCAGCTRKEVLSAFGSPRGRALMLLCDPVGHWFQVADGVVRLADLTRARARLPETLDLLVVTNERRNEPSADEPGVAARLCLEHACTRVLRVDLPHGRGITEAHQRVIGMFWEKLEAAIEGKLRFPYAVALQLAQEEAQSAGLSTAVWASLTLVGGP